MCTCATIRTNTTPSRVDYIMLYSAKETYNIIDPTNHSHRIGAYHVSHVNAQNAPCLTRMNAWYFTNEWVMSHIRINHVHSHKCKQHDTHRHHPQIPIVSRSYPIPHLSDLYVVYVQIVCTCATIRTNTTPRFSSRRSRVSHLNTSYEPTTYTAPRHSPIPPAHSHCEWVMSHIWVSRINKSCARAPRHSQTPPADSHRSRVMSHFRIRHTTQPHTQHHDPYRCHPQILVASELCLTFEWVI